MATVACSHFYKILLVPKFKVTKFIFYDIFSSLLTLSSQNVFFENFLCKTKVCLLWEKSIFFNGKPKITKKKQIEFEKLKISQTGQISGLKLFFSRQIYFYLTKNILRPDSINREEYIIKGRFSHFMRWGIL